MNVSKLSKQPKVAVIAAIVATALAGASGAQQAQEPVRENANRPPTAQSPQIARADAGLQTLEQFLENKPLRVSKLVGMELQTRNGDNLAEVKDIIPSAAPGRDMQLILSTGGLGADEKLIAVPFDEVQINADGDELYTNRTRDQLASSPPITLGSRANNAGSSAQQTVADLIGAEVVGSSGDQVGEVDDIVISTAGADSVRAVLQVGGVAGIGEKRISLPLSQLAVERAGNDEPKLRVAMDKAALERVPEFKYESETSAL